MEVDNVPIGWSVRPIWSMFVREKNIAHPEETMLSVFRDHGVVEKNSHKNLNVTADNRNIYQLVDKGWLVVNRMKAWQGSVGISSYRGIVSGHYLCFRPVHEESSRYLNWLFRSSRYTADYGRLSRGVRPGQAEIDNDQLRVLQVLLPPLHEQQRIADFLDHQVALLDRALNLQRRRTALLTESLISLIGEVMDDQAKGDVIDTPLKYVSDIVDTEHKTAPEVAGGGYWVAGTSAVRNGSLVNDSLYETDLTSYLEWTRRGKPSLGDLLLTREAPVGEAAKIGESDPSICIGQRVVMLRPCPRLNSDFLLFALLSPRTMRFYDDVTQGSLHPHLNISDIGRIPVAMRPKARQTVVVGRLTDARDRTERDRRLAQRSIELLMERKQALITAAVTGQFDVTAARSVA